MQKGGKMLHEVRKKIAFPPPNPLSAPYFRQKIVHLCRNYAIPTTKIGISHKISHKKTILE